MRAFVITAPQQSTVIDIPDVHPNPGDVLVEVERVGICGTDVEFFNGEMAYLHSGNAHYPIRIGHEWTGRVIEVGDQSDSHWLGKRVTGDTMLGCRKCARCIGGYQYLCEDRFEIGIRNDYAGALAEQLIVPTLALHEIPNSLDETIGAMVEPGGNSLRAFMATQVTPSERLLILGPGTIGLLCAQFAMAQGVEVHLAGRQGRSLEFAKNFGVASVSTSDHIPDTNFHGVIDATFDEAMPAKALDLVEPGRRVVYIGISHKPSLIDTRELVLRDITAVGILSASPGLAQTIEIFSQGSVDPRPLVADVVGLSEAGKVLSGWRPDGAGAGPKIHIDPRK
ncbi:unannotated protein [freshwater metagenome]|uniref:Unannotated protein n=1 Tax=freshwater metagenome TaxID=449393 RepID=A0A6J7XVS2_9ZZZZ|nr:alcohol dehydrogenase catalytic domain-containing protein [Actinomycetota bacterium]